MAETRALQKKHNDLSPISIRINTAHGAIRVSDDSDRNLAGTLNRLSVLLGRQPLQDPNQAKVIIQFIKKNLSNYSTDDINIALELLAEKKLDYDFENINYSYYSGVFFSNLMQSYSRFRHKYLKNEEPEMDERAKKKLNDEAIERMLNEEYYYFTQNGCVNDKTQLGTFVRIFDWLWSEKKITLTKEEANAIKELARKEWSEYLIREQAIAESQGRISEVRHYKAILDNFDMHKDTHVVKSYAKKIAVQQCFERHKPDMI